MTSFCPRFRIAPQRSSREMPMVVCSECGKEAADDALFCGYCGSKVQQGGEKKTLFGVAAIPKARLDQPPLAAAPQPGEPVKPTAPIEKTPMPAEAPQPATMAPEASLFESEASALPDAGSMTAPMEAVPAHQEYPAPVFQGEAALSSGVSAPVSPEPSVIAPEEAPQPAIASAEPAPVPSPSASPLSAGDVSALYREKKSELPPEASLTPKTDKGDEKAFFGDTLSRYGMAPISRAELEQGNDLQQVESELKREKRRSYGILVVGLFVMLAIVAAIVFLMMTGAES